MWLKPKGSRSDGVSCQRATHSRSLCAANHVAHLPIVLTSFDSIMLPRRSPRAHPCCVPGTPRPQHGNAAAAAFVVQVSQQADLPSLVSKSLTASTRQYIPAAVCGVSFNLGASPRFQISKFSGILLFIM